MINELEAITKPREIRSGMRRRTGEQSERESSQVIYLVLHGSKEVPDNSEDDIRGKNESSQWQVENITDRNVRKKLTIKAT